MHRFGELLSGIVDPGRFSAHADTIVAGVADDSRRVVPDGLFIAVTGTAADGRQYIPEALRRGGRFIVGHGLDAGEIAAAGGVAVDVADVRLALGLIAARWHRVTRRDIPDFKLLGVTGTNGKSTTTFMTAAVLRAAGLRCGMLGTVQYDLCGRTVRAPMTTPGALDLASYIRECVDAGATAAVMEVSSHALDQRRTAGVRFSAAAFTNLTQDHLDYHGSFEAYAAAKARLFSGLDAEAVAVVNQDDGHHVRMLQDCPARVLRFSVGSRADLSARISRDTIRGTLYRMRVGGRELVLENALVGRHNVYNALAAAGLALAAGAEPEAIEAGLNSVRNVPGRLQRVPCLEGVEVFVDYAHTDDALRNVLSVLRPLTRGRLITVFGCGGDRDRGKRPKMAAATAEFSDAILVTSDNPRTEEPLAIINEILTGFDAASRKRTIVEPDRRAAISAALAGARPGDVVLIAGKGHEDYQVLGTERVHFDDVEVAIQASAELSSRHRERSTS